MYLVDLVLGGHAKFLVLLFFVSTTFETIQHSGSSELCVSVCVF